MEKTIQKLYRGGTKPQTDETENRNRRKRLRHAQVLLQTQRNSQLAEQAPFFSAAEQQGVNSY